MAFQFQSVVGVSASLQSDLGVGLGDLGVLVGVYMLPGIFLALPGGALGDRFGEKRISLIGLLLMSLGGVLTAVAPDMAVATAGRIIAGVGAVALNIMQTSMVAAWFRESRLVTAMSILVMSWPVGIGIALVSGPFIAQAGGWQAMMWITVVASIVTGALMAIFYRNPAPALEMATRTKSPSAGSRLSRRDFWLASWSGQVWGFYNVGYILLISFLPAVMIARNTTPETAGFITSLATWLLIVTVPLGGLLIDRLGRSAAIMYVCFSIMGLAMAGAALLPVAFAAVLIVGVFAGLPAGAIMALPAASLSPSVRTRGLGVFFTWYYALMAVMPPVAGWIGDASGFVPAPLFFAAVVMAATMLSLFVFRRLLNQDQTGTNAPVQ